MSAISYQRGSTASGGPRPSPDMTSNREMSHTALDIGHMISTPCPYFTLTLDQVQTGFSQERSRTTLGAKIEASDQLPFVPLT